MNSFNTYIEQIASWPFLQIQLWGNTMGDYAVALGALVVFLIAFKIVQVIVLAQLRRLAEKTATDIDDTLIKIVESLRPPFYSFLAFYLALFFVAVSGGVQAVINGVLIVFVVYQIMIAAQILIDFVIEKKFSDEDDADDETRASAMRLVGNIVKGALWIIAILMILSNLGINITSLVAGLGVGGLAIAFALQQVFADLFASFAIYFDKPFKVGDFIAVGNSYGTVEKIGIKTTRLRALQGEELVISNQELTSARVQNYGKMEERRVAFTIGVTYDTPNDKLKRIPDIISTILEKQENARPEWVRFKEFGDSAFIFEVVYYALTSDYYKYMDTREQVNLAIREAFEKEGIDFAYPTQTIYVQK